MGRHYINMHTNSRKDHQEKEKCKEEQKSQNTRTQDINANINNESRDELRKMRNQELKEIR